MKNQIHIFGRQNANRRNTFTLRMAPMIDVIFLLLLFFFVSSNWRPSEEFLPLRLSAAQPPAINTAKPEPLIINISSTQTGCEVQIGRQQAVRIENESIEENLAGLLEEIKNCLHAQKRFASDPIEIICAPDVKWDHLAKIYNLFYGAGLTDITFQMTE